MFAQGQLDWFSILNAFDHLLNHTVVQGETEDLWYAMSGFRSRAWEISQRQTGLWNGEERHFGWRSARRGRVWWCSRKNLRLFWLAAKSRRRVTFRCYLDIKAVDYEFSSNSRNDDSSMLEEDRRYRRQSHKKADNHSSSSPVCLLGEVLV